MSAGKLIVSQSVPVERLVAVTLPGRLEAERETFYAFQGAKAVLEADCKNPLNANVHSDGCLRSPVPLLSLFELVTHNRNDWIEGTSPDPHPPPAALVDDQLLEDGRLYTLTPVAGSLLILSWLVKCHKQSLVSIDDLVANFRDDRFRPVDEEFFKKYLNEQMQQEKNAFFVKCLDGKMSFNLEEGTVSADLLDKFYSAAEFIGDLPQQILLASMARYVPRNLLLPVLRTIKMTPDVRSQCHNVLKSAPTGGYKKSSQRDKRGSSIMNFFSKRKKIA